MSANLVNYINHEMGEINRLTDELYEALFDDDSFEVLIVTQSLIDRLKDIQKSNK